MKAIQNVALKRFKRCGAVSGRSDLGDELLCTVTAGTDRAVAVVVEDASEGIGQLLVVRQGKDKFRFKRNLIGVE